ncbi:MAG TPA: pyridoxal phosphate-dependent aminotransferase [Spirochaetota bacterium]|nr:pyridoxal phosphate-dependent aminotransferase [Spirochaetota bacterium]HNT10097.1 pyridoxal phosphate-dependent aminotransferase [Spirochaetota bacterium]HNV47632.1 pyridoxal phosphate-dependent aminotransferase [Spirochaetota bacterium]HOS38830.1 pyridoxal phosphate-dependent aminotransferase [Spirochaetota bacterium]HPU86914.1 pyridoxal phosphate-dependent aminotransferase [Spirochaetota bacterium]
MADLPVGEKIYGALEKSSWIRRMFEVGTALKKEHGEENVFDLTLGNPDLDPPLEFFDTIAALIQERKKGAHGYMPNAGYPDVLDTVGRLVSATHGVEVGGRSIVMTCGAAGGLNVVFKTILDPGDEVIVPRPYFAEYGAYIDNHGGRMVTVDTAADFSLDVDAIDAAMTARTRAVLINTPNNPTGKLYREAELAALGALIDARAGTTRPVYLIADEPYREIVYDGLEAPPILKQCRQSIVVTSYSKSLSIPGERIGYIAVNPSCAGADTLMAGLIMCNRILGFVNAPALMQRAVAALATARVNTQAYTKRRDLICDGLEYAGYRFDRPEGAFYVFCKSPIPDDVAFVQHLQRYNILTVPGVGFGGPGHFRICYCVPESVITRAIPRFKEALDTLPKGTANS